MSIYGEMYKSLGIDKEVTGLFPTPGAGKGFKANSYVNSLVMMFIGGGKYIEDIRKIRIDKGLREVCKMEEVPGGDAIGDWMRNRSEEKIESTQRVNKNLSKKVLKKGGKKELTLDIDAMEVEGWKEEAEWTYKGNKGYMPMLGFIPEIDWCIGYEFREGNRAPRERNYEFLKEIIEFIEEGTRKEKEIKRVRIDAAGYQAKVINQARYLVLR
ncbi:transposase, partial [bacterium]|nr:transposase [bacterium]